MRRYDDPVEVRRGWVSGPGHRGEGPEQFRWRRRLWHVQTVQARWLETGAWWQRDTTRAMPLGSLGSLGELLTEREIWRVEANSNHHSPGGVFDLAFDWSDGGWQLIGCVD